MAGTVEFEGRRLSEVRPLLEYLQSKFGGKALEKDLRKMCQRPYAFSDADINTYLDAFAAEHGPSALRTMINVGNRNGKTPLM